MLSLSEIANKMKALRQDRELKQADMKMVNGMSQQQVSKFEKGSDIYLSTFLRILDGFGLELLIVTREEAVEIKSRQAEDVSTRVSSDPWSKEIDHLGD